jgi:TrmH family RNA methyltransferase
MEKITSASNKYIKLAKSLRTKAKRAEARLFICEGERLIKDAKRVKYVFVSKEYKGYIPPCENTFLISQSLFESISETKNPQGIMAICAFQKDFDIGEVKDGFAIYCDNISDPGNLGTILRSSYSFGARAVLLSKGCVHPYNSKVVRSSMGAIFNLPILEDASFTDVIKFGFTPYALDLKGATRLSNTKFAPKSAIIVGNEANGISGEILNKCENNIKIPQVQGESLNASVAASIAMFELTRGRI